MVPLVLDLDRFILPACGPGMDTILMVFGYLGWGGLPSGHLLSTGSNFSVFGSCEQEETILHDLPELKHCEFSLDFTVVFNTWLFAL